MKRKTTQIFEFNPELDAAILADLYGGDTCHIEKVFKDFISLSGLFLTESAGLLKVGNIKHLKTAIHKFKPMFFYTGLTASYEQFEEFEKRCEKTTQTAEIIPVFKHIKKNLISDRKKIESEINRLHIFNSLAP